MRICQLITRLQFLMATLVWMVTIADSFITSVGPATPTAITTLTNSKRIATPSRANQKSYRNNIICGHTRRHDFIKNLSLNLSQNNPKEPEQQDTKTIREKIDDLLDTQFFDPDKVLNDYGYEIDDYGNESQNKNIQGDDEKEDKKNSNNPLVVFAKLVKNDYETAEALFAAGFISILVVLTQELLRMVKYGDGYIPFTNGSSAGGLF